MVTHIHGYLHVRVHTHTQRGARACTPTCNQAERQKYADIIKAASGGTLQFLHSPGKPTLAGTQPQVTLASFLKGQLIYLIGNTLL